jgi:hypothetical protein
VDLLPCARHRASAAALLAAGGGVAVGPSGVAGQLPAGLLNGAAAPLELALGCASGARICFRGVIIHDAQR